MTEAYQALVSAENMPELGTLAGTLTTDLRGLYQDAEVSLNWREIGEMPVPLPMADVFLKDDGFGGPVDRQGHGLQRAFIFTLLQHLARTAVPEAEEPTAEGEAGDDGAAAPVAIGAQAPTLILAIEEPERAHDWGASTTAISALETPLPQLRVALPQSPAALRRRVSGRSTAMVSSCRGRPSGRATSATRTLSNWMAVPRSNSRRT
ncbi:MAG TPA: hypothetical protein PK823_07125 [Novosphingobium sp.]|nr:hypothetical protein [Novosphingobium sp.]